MMNLSAYANKRIAVAVSGGVDSAVLLHRLVGVRDFYAISLCVVHCEHGIRGEESREDMAFVQSLCASYGVECYTFSNDCVALAAATGESLETAARNFRYACFQRLIDEGKADYIALAHHQGDQAETVLFRLCRGSALAGAAAMKQENGVYLRPMLNESRESIMAYAAANGVAYREDGTNALRDASRNVLRLDILPALETLVPGAKENLAAFAATAGEDDALLQQLSDELISTVSPIDGHDSGYRVSVSNQAPLFRRACLKIMKALGIEKDYTARHLAALTGLCGLQTGASCTLPQGVVARREYGQIAFFQGDSLAEELPALPIKEGQFVYGRYAITLSFTPIDGKKCLYLDADKLPGDAVVRLKKQGDCFEKFGGGRKSLKKYLVDKKISALQRDGLPLIAEENGQEVYAVFGVEIAKSVAVDGGTKRTLYLSINEK